MGDGLTRARPRSLVGASAPSRRQFLRYAGGLTLASAVPMFSGCTGSGSSEPQGGSTEAATDGPVTLKWWDQFRPLTELLEGQLFPAHTEENPDVTIEREQMDGADLAEALQLARRSNQMPDIHSIAGLESTPAALVANGWFQPIEDYVDLDGTFVADHLYDGIHRFDGKVYTFPVFDERWHISTPWLNTELFDTAGIDPGEAATTWDQFRDVARELTTQTPDGVSGLVLPMKEAGYLNDHLLSFAALGGAPVSIGPPNRAGVDWTTGEYVWSSQPFLDAMEFLLSLQDDGALHPSSASLGPRDARARWAAGEAAMYMWGPWVIGGLLVDEPEAVERGIGAWPAPAPDTTRAAIHRDPSSGPFWVSSQSANPAAAANALMVLTTDDAYASLAEAMDQPPINPDAVAAADVHETYRTMLGYQQDDVRIGPVPQVANAAVGAVLAEMRDVHPNPGEIAQAVLTGSMDDYRGALQKYDDEMQAERDRAIEVVRSSGAEVGVEDWVFDNWEPTEDYTPDLYG